MTSLPPELNPRGPGKPTKASAPPSAPARSGRRRALTIVSGTLAVMIVGFSVVGSALAAHFVGESERVGIGDHANAQGESANGSQNYLLVGSDTRAGLTQAELDSLHLGKVTADNAGGRRSDTMILLHVSAQGQKATMISLPRDSFVTIPAYTDDKGVHHAASHNKLNAAYEKGGAALAVATVELATHVRIDHYIEVGFDGFVRMVDALGSIDVCAPKAVSDKNSGLVLHAGINTLNGAQALAFVRARYIDATADIGRMHRQQQFLGAIFRKATSQSILLNPIKLTGFLNATLTNVRLDKDLTRDDLVNLATSTHGLSASNVVFATVPLSSINYKADGVTDAVLWAPERSNALFAAINADQPIGSQATTGITTSTVTVAPNRITVQVENGAGVSGLGGRAAADLKALGFVSAGPAKNSDHTRVTKTLILYDPSFSDSIKTLQAAFPDATVQAVPGQGKVFRVIAGSAYSAPKAVTVAGSGSSGSTSSGSSGDVSSLHTTSAADTTCSL
jgi:LCP family protein required for cell wall assembly